MFVLGLVACGLAAATLVVVRRRSVTKLALARAAAVARAIAQQPSPDTFFPYMTRAFDPDDLDKSPAE